MCSNKLTDLWNTSLLFDLNYKFELIGASLLALAKSIYHVYSFVVPLLETLTRNLNLVKKNTKAR